MINCPFESILSCHCLHLSREPTAFRLRVPFSASSLEPNCLSFASEKLVPFIASLPVSSISLRFLLAIPSFQSKNLYNFLLLSISFFFCKINPTRDAFNRQFVLPWKENSPIVFKLIRILSRHLWRRLYDEWVIWVILRSIILFTFPITPCWFRSLEQYPHLIRTRISATPGMIWRTGAY